MKKQNYAALALGLAFSIPAFANVAGSPATSQPTVANPPSNSASPGAMDSPTVNNDVNRPSGGAITTPTPSDTADTMNSPSLNAPNTSSIGNPESTVGGATPSRDTIKDAQRALSANGFSVTSDGVAGPRTQSAIRQFQAKNGLPQTGQLDTATMSALNVSGDESRDSAADEPSEF